MKKFKKYIACFSMSVQSTFTYRLNFFVKLIAVFIPICVQLFLWTAIYSSSTNKMIYGRTHLDMMFYLLFAFYINFFITCNVADQVASDIKSGSLNQFLVRPVNYLGYNISNFIGSKAVSLILTIFLSGLSIVIFRLIFNYKLNIGNIILFSLMTIVSLLIQFIIYLNISMLAFWISDTWGVFFGARFIIQILSGSLLPLELLGQKLSSIFVYLPFQYMVYFPLNVLQDRVVPKTLLSGVAIEFIWIELLLLTFQLLWRKGQKKYMAIGG